MIKIYLLMGYLARYLGRRPVLPGLGVGERESRSE